MEFNTKLLHGKAIVSNPSREILPPVSQVTAFRYESMEELEKVFLHKSMGFAYSRIGNPTLSAFEQRVKPGESLCLCGYGKEKGNECGKSIPGRSGTGRRETDDDPGKGSPGEGGSSGL